MEIRGKLVLITGGLGFIGSHLVDELIDRNAESIVVDNCSEGRISNLEYPDDIFFVRGDICSRKLIRNIFAKWDFDLIIHLAAQASVPRSVENPLKDMKSNIAGTLNLLNESKGKDLLLAYGSSSAVYGQPSNLPVSENSPTNPISPYGLSKLCSEKYCSLYHQIFGLRSIILRYFNVYGPRQKRYLMFDIARKLKQNRKEITILGDGNQVRDFIFIDDAVKATLTIIEEAETEGDIYNVGSGKGTKVNDVVKLFLEVMQLSEKVQVRSSSSSWPGDVKRVYADITKLRKLGFTPSFALKDGISRFIQRFQETCATTGSS